MHHLTSELRREHFLKTIETLGSAKPKIMLECLWSNFPCCLFFSATLLSKSQLCNIFWEFPDLQTRAFKELKMAKKHVSIFPLISFALYYLSLVNKCAYFIWIKRPSCSDNSFCENFTDDIKSPIYLPHMILNYPPISSKQLQNVINSDFLAQFV